MPALRVLVDARVRPGEQGGVEQAIAGLASGLSGSAAADVDIGFLVQDDPSWLRPYIDGPCRIVQARTPTARQQPLIDAAARLRPVLGPAVAALLEAGAGPLPRPDPAVGAFDPSVVHFMRHRGWRTARPNIYVPHDLQHVVLPENFSRLTRLYRKVVYGAMASQADAVVALTPDQAPLIARHHQLPADRLITIGWASVLDMYSVPPAHIDGLPARFAFFPAKSWAHKRHDLLVSALMRLRARGVDVPVVLTGGRTQGWQKVLSTAHAGGVDDLLIDLGYVGEAEVLALYQGAGLLVFPSQHEGFGMPVVEAFASGVPVVCADLPVMRTIAGDAAIFFTVDDAEDLARAIEQVWTDEALGGALITAGRARSATFTWGGTAAAYLSLYRRVAARLPAVAA